MNYAPATYTSCGWPHCGCPSTCADAPTLSDAQRDAILYAPYRSRFSGGRLVMSGKSSPVNVRTARKLAAFGLIELHESYSRQDGGNVWTATVTERGERVRASLQRQISGVTSP